MKRILVSLLSFILLTSWLFAFAADGKTSLWKLTHNDNVMYLAGTIHALPTEVTIPEAFHSAFEQAALIVFEADVGALASAEFANKMMTRSMLKDDLRLPDLLSREVYQKMQQFLSEQGAAASALDDLKPSIAALNINLLQLKNIGYDQPGVDHHFYQRAVNENKSRMFLETTDFQLNLMLELGKHDPSSLIQTTLEQVTDYAHVMQQTLQAWRTGDQQLMNSLVIQPAKADDPLLYQQLFVARNNTWLPALTRMANTSTTELVLVGAGHLYGEDSVIALLKAEGFELTQL